MIRFRSHRLTVITLIVQIALASVIAIVIAIPPLLAMIEPPRAVRNLEFRILVGKEMPAAEYQRYVDRLHSDGPKEREGDSARWLAVNAGAEIRPSENYKMNLYVLGYVTPTHDGTRRCLDARTELPWYLTRVDVESEPMGETVAFSFDEQGGIYFGELTEANVDKALAIVVDDKVVSAPIIHGRISEAAKISGPRGHFSAGDLDTLLGALSTHIRPATFTRRRVLILIVAAIWLFFASKMLFFPKSKPKQQENEINGTTSS